MAQWYEAIHASKRYRLLEVKRAVNGNEYIYLKGVTSLAAGDAVTYDEAGVTTLLAANAKGPVAIAMAANTSSSTFSWFCIRGTVAANFVANSADDATVGRETTNGKLGDGRAAGDQIANCFARGSTGGSTGSVNIQIMYPFVDDFLGA